MATPRSLKPDGAASDFRLLEGRLLLLELVEELSKIDIAARSFRFPFGGE